MSQFDAAIPGQSLTKAPKSMPFENPPQYPDVEGAANAIWERAKTPKMALKIKAMLEAGADAESIAKTITFAGFTEGKWTPDVAMMLQLPVASMVAVVGKKAGAKGIKPLKEDRDLEDFLMNLQGDASFEEDITTVEIDESTQLTEEERQITAEEVESQDDSAMMEDFTPSGGFIDLEE